MAKRGRPGKTIAAADRKKVAELLAEGAPIGDVAKMVGLSAPTFRKYFRTEIDVAKRDRANPRPSRKISEAQREKVRRYIGCRMTVQQVAYVLGYQGPDDLADFKRDFAVEIEIGAALYRAKVIDRLDTQMDAGVTGATNRLEAMTQIAPAEGVFKSREEPEPYRGKKQAAIDDAEAAVSAGSKFAPRGGLRVATSGGKVVE